jgi:hypothetical protein
VLGKRQYGRTTNKETDAGQDMTSPRNQLLRLLSEQDIGLPDDGLTLEKIRDRGRYFHVEDDDWIGFRIVRHPTMYLSDALGGHNRSPARFHIDANYRLDLNDYSWEVDEHHVEFDYDPSLVIQAELDAIGQAEILEEQIETVKSASHPEEAFEEEFGSLIRYWKDKFADVHGRPVPNEKHEEIVRLLVDELRSRAGLDGEYSLE